MKEGLKRIGVGAALGALAGMSAKELALASMLSYWHDRAGLVLVGALLGAIVFSTRLRALLVAATIVLLGAWAGVAFTPLCEKLAPGLVRSDAIVPADAVFVLSSRVQPDGELTVGAMSRLVRALELLGEGKAPRLVLSELAPPSKSYKDAARALMDHLGLKQEILTVGPVDNTHDEAVLVGRLAKERGWQRVLIVTSPTHTRRACAAMEHEGVKAVCVPATETQFDVQALGGPDERLRAFESLGHEWVGYYVYRLRGWIDAKAN